ncbi:MAG: VWA domain-containing protein [Acidobacteriota bacterium]|nr:VWA domain-containing protein [Acidobacteriota bacterium]
MFELTHPLVLLALPLPLLVHWLAPAYKEHKDSLQTPFFGRLVQLTGQEPRQGAVILERLKFQRIMLGITWLLLVFAAAGPQWLGEPITRTKSARDLMIAVDLSGSMETEDFTTADGESISRLDAVKLVLSEFVSRRKHDRLGLIVFGRSPYLQSPFTEDHETWLTLLNESEAGMAGQQTMFGDAIGLALKLFENSETENRVLIVLTDGNDTGSKVPPVEASRVAKARGVKIYNIAVGDPETTGEQALDLDVLQSIADITGGAWYQAVDREQLEGIYRTINELEPEQFETLTHRPRRSLHHYPIAVVAVIYIVFHTSMTFLAAPRREKEAAHV